MFIVQCRTVIMYVLMEFQVFVKQEIFSLSVVSQREQDWPRFVSMDHGPMCVGVAGQLQMLMLHADNLDIHFIVSFMESN